VEAEISDDELRRAQRYLVGTHAVGLQRASARAGTMSLNALYGLGHDLDRRYPAMIEAVTPASVRSVAREVLRFDRVVRSVVEVGPEES
jgi:zinc protease